MKTAIHETECRSIAIGESATLECFHGHQYEWTRHDHYDSAKCPTCAEAEIAHGYNKCIAKIEEGIRKATPGRYLATRTDHPDFNFRLWQAIQSWRPSEDAPWLGLVGPTGKCKTRCTYLLLPEVAKSMIRRGTLQYTTSQAPSFMATTGYDFAAETLRQFSDDWEEKQRAKAYLSTCRHSGILVIDDMDKARLATASGSISAAGSELHAVIDFRHAANKATIWSANLPPEGIVAGMPPNIGAPMAGRLRECSKIVTIK